MFNMEPEAMWRLYSGVTFLTMSLLARHCK